MAYPITAEAFRLFSKAYRQVADITFHGKTEDMTITESDILQGGLFVNRYCVSGNKIEIGSVVAAELTLKLNNSTGKFDNTVFEGAELYVNIGTKDWDAQNQGESDYTYVPMGYFTIDEAPRKLEQITLTALDRMVMFDKKVESALFSFPMTVETLLTRICDICNVTLGCAANNLINSSYVINEAPSAENLTYRKILSWIAEITGTCAFIDWNGQLILKWYESGNTSISIHDRFSSDLQENPVTITGVQIKNGKDVYLVGDDGYALNIESNALIQNKFRTVANRIYTAVSGFTYTPFTANVKPMPHLYPLDIIEFVNKENISIPSIITNYTYTLNANTKLEGKGETATKNGYASANPLTKHESAIIDSIKKEQNETLNDRLQTVLAFNELISNAMGMYVSQIEQSDGSVIRYMHNSPKLEESKTIFTMTASGIAWTTTGWNNGDPVWAYGVTSAGDALFRTLSAEGIEVSKFGEDYTIEITPRAFKIYYRDMLVTNIEADEMDIPKANFTTHAECGKIRILPYNLNGTLVGTNIVFMD